MIFKIQRVDFGVYGMPPVTVPVTFEVSIGDDDDPSAEPFRLDAAVYGTLAPNPYYIGDADAEVIHAVRRASAPYQDGAGEWVTPSVLSGGAIVPAIQ